MLRKLNYSVTFPSTGRTLSADLQLGPGFYAITGPNESGKTMVLEVTRWLLFGANALRGKADDYKTLRATGEFVIRGNVIEIERSQRGATMKRNGSPVATGTKPVNLKVVEELGFGMQVFDIANSINQGEVEKLGSMTPGARKTMVDNVLGLSSLDVVAKWAADEAKALDRHVQDLQGQQAPLLPPPEEPEGYLPSESTKVRLADIVRDADELAQIDGWLSHTRARPEKPTTKIDLPAANLESLAAKRRAAREDVERLRAQVNALPETATYTTELLDQVEAAWTAHDAYMEEARWARQNPLPETSYHDLVEMQGAWCDRNEWAYYEQQLAEVERLRAALDAVDKIDCPSCGHNFALHAEHAARLQEELKAAEALVDKPTVDKPDEPRLKSADITSLQLAWEQADEARHAAFKAMPVIERPALTPNEIMGARQRIDQVAERKALAEQLAVAERTFGAMVDYEAMLAERKAYETALAHWQTAELEYQKWQTERDTKIARKAQLAGSVEARDRITAEYQAAVQYETALAAWQTAKEVHDRLAALIAEKTFAAEEHRKVRQVLAVLRGKIKQHVLPSLNQVSSQLLRQMTGGQRNLVVIDDDFEITVDGQALDTLSGSGKAVANLSLRIALGQVLTHRVMPLMLADEIDASMDAFRAEKTADVLRMLEERVSQVLLVSHKPVDAPHHVRLGGPFDHEYDLDGDAA